MENIEQRWQSILQEYFPGVIVRQNDRIISEEVPILDVFQVPDGRSGEFLQFIVANGEEIARSHSLEEPQFIPHSCSATKTHYQPIATLDSIQNQTSEIRDSRHGARATQKQ